MQRLFHSADQTADNAAINEADAGWDIAIDVGGTFIDFVARPPKGEDRWRTAKRLRDSADTAESIVAGLLGFLREEGIAPDQITRLRHGTTIATNALLELREPPVALITTAGFADVLTLGRQNRRDLNQPFPHLPVPPHICPEDLRFELPERVDSRGNIVMPLRSAALEQLVDQIAANLGPQTAPPAIAICLLFAPLNPAHELAAATALRARWPTAHLSLSHQVDPRLREFERSLATILDAYIRPTVSGYLRSLDQSLAKQGLSTPWIMRSVGGLAPIAQSVAAPLTLAMSGPAAAAHAIRDSAVRYVSAGQPTIGLDIGGTTADICLVTEGSVLTSNELTLGRLDVRVSSADVTSVAVGGGSILQMAGGLLRVGPHSAGSSPGPACFGRGGRAPTLTDAALLAGLLPAKLGASVVLDRQLALDAMTSELGISEQDVPSIAFGAVKVAEAMIAEAVRRKALSRGIDPREAILVAAGGGGALHAAEIADRVGCRTVIVPRGSGVLAAGGLMHVGLCEQTERPIDMQLEPASISALANLATEDAARLRQILVQWSHGKRAAAVHHELDICYQGQGHSLAVTFDNESDDATSLTAKFDALHERVRGHAFETKRCIVALRSIATLSFDDEASLQFDAIQNVIDSNTLEHDVIRKPLHTFRHHALKYPVQHRLVATDQPTSCPVWERASLPAGEQLSAPALIDAIDTTVWLPPGWHCEMLPDATLLLSAVDQAP
jgi:N-methylhydantoinase A